MWSEIKKNIIFSVSGWRAILVGNDSSPVNRDYLSCFYYGITSYILAKQEKLKEKRTLRIAVGADSRMSGIVLMELAKKTLTEHHCETIILGLIPGPAIMAYTKSHADGFIYFTASHNPSEYNGIKFGSHDGKVQSQAEYSQMMNIFDSLSEEYSAQTPSIAKELEEHSHVLPQSMGEVEINEDAYIQATHSYKDLIFKSIFKGVENPKKIFLAKYADYQKKHKKLGIVIDPNGGARSWTFDTEILQSLGIECHSINNQPSVYAHPIIPEGESLSQARECVLEKNTDNSIFWPIAVVTDCDGDRGNTIFVSQADRTESRSLSAQEVCLSVLQIELAWLSYIRRINGESADCTSVTHDNKSIQSNANLPRPVAVAFNGPSTLRADIVAKQHSAALFRGEVGEANIVSLGERLVSEGYEVPLVGEASNGGVIVFPSTVRDPLCSILSFFKGILWAKELGLPEDILAQNMALPVGHSTETEDPLAKFTLPELPYSTITKKIMEYYTAYHQNFVKLFRSYRIDIARYTFRNYCASESIEISPEPSIEISTGGLAICFYSPSFEQDIPIAFVWLRPSGTEPVVRLLADVCYENKTLERDLIHTWRDYLKKVLYDVDSN